MVHAYPTHFLTYASVANRASATAIIPLLLQNLSIRSVVDFGCAQGAWLSEWQRLGVPEIFGIDGAYVDRAHLLIDPDHFLAADLGTPMRLNRRFDLVQCLEVAEHIPAQSADEFIANLTTHGSIILFSAATPGQGGEYHVNEQSFEYWRDLFARHEFVLFDCIRPLIARHKEIQFWYRYNTFLYVHKEAIPRLPEAWIRSRVPPGEAIANVEPMHYRMRKRIVLMLPDQIINRVARTLATFHSSRSRMEQPPMSHSHTQPPEIPTPVAESPPDIHSGSPERFGYSWNLFQELTEQQKEQFDGWSSSLSPEAWQGATFLDVGCGMGRNSAWALHNGAASGVAIDVDERSLQAARRNNPENVEVLRMSAYDIAFQDRFDVVFSIGVVHHLENPELALRNMVKAAKPGGDVMIWVYGRENNGWIVHLFDPVRRHLLSRLPMFLTNGLAWGLTALLRVLLKCGFGKQPYYDFLRKIPFQHLKHIVLDHILPRIALYYRREEAEALLLQAGLKDIRAQWVNQISWSVCGKKAK